MKRYLLCGLGLSFLLLGLVQTMLAQETDVRVSGTVYADMNGDGVRDDSELGLGGLPVELYDEAGEVLLGRISADIYGEYEFTVAPALYRLKVSNGSPESGFTDVIDVTDGQDALDIYIGVAPEGFGEPTAVSRIESQTGVSLDIIAFGSLSVLALIIGIFVVRKRGLI